MFQAISDDEEIGRVRSGDTGSYGVLAARYDGRLRGVAQGLLRSKAAAEDVVQGAHILALTHLDQYRGSGYFRWMYSIVLNEARTQMRKEKRTFELGEFSTRRLSDRARTPEQQAVDTDVEQILTHAVEALRPFIALPSGFGR